jgi:hypothetical protein
MSLPFSFSTTAGVKFHRLVKQEACHKKGEMAWKLYVSVTVPHLHSLLKRINGAVEWMKTPLIIVLN